MNERIRNLMQQRLQALGVPRTNEKAETPRVKEELSFGVHLEPGSRELLVEFLFQSGNRTAFAYAELKWMNYEFADSRLDLGFGESVVSIYGQNLDGLLFEMLMDHRVRWVREITEGEAKAIPDNAMVYLIEISLPARTWVEDEEVLLYSEDELPDDEIPEE